MTPQQVVALVVRLCSIWFVISSLEAIAFYLELARVGETSHLATELLIVTYLSLAVVCWLFPMTIAHFLVPNTKFENIINLQPFQAIYVACVVFGLWVSVIKALPFISIYVSMAGKTLHEGQSLTVISSADNGHFLAGTIQLLVGLVLIFKADFLTKKIISLHSGTP